MIYRIVFLPRAEKEFKKLPAIIKEKITNALEHLAKNPLLGKPRSCTQGRGKPLKAEYKGLHSDRVGDYRIVYKILQEKTLIVIFKIGHRREVYR